MNEKQNAQCGKNVPTRAHIELRITRSPIHSITAHAYNASFLPGDMRVIENDIQSRYMAQECQNNWEEISVRSNGEEKEQGSVKSHLWMHAQ